MWTFRNSYETRNPDPYEPALQAMNLYPGCVPKRIITYRIDQTSPYGIRDHIPCHRLQILFLSQRPIMKATLPDNRIRKIALPKMFCGQRFELLHTGGQIKRAIELHEPMHMIRHGDVAPRIGIGG